MSQKKSKQSARNDPVFKAKERDYQKESKQSARKDSVFKVIVNTTNKRVGSPCLNVPYSVLKGHYVTVLYIK